MSQVAPPLSPTAPLAASRYPWPGSRPYHAYAAYFRQRFGSRMQKLSIHAGFSCPNRDGSRGTGGCTFCNNEAFTPSYCQPHKGIARQIEEGILFHDKRYKRSGGYLAYFQSYSNTYAPLEELRRCYQEALQHPQVAGIVISTRPDCVDEAKLDLIATLGTSHYVAVEYGIESCYDETLARIRRGHTFEQTQWALRQTAARGIPCGGHLILGLPGETEAMMLQEASLLNTLPLNMLKLHQLQLLKGSTLGQEYLQHPEWEADGHFGTAFSLQEYIQLVCNFLERLQPQVMMERFAGEVPPRYQAAPRRSWHRADGSLLRNEDIPLLVEQELLRRGTYQGIYYHSTDNK